MLNRRRPRPAALLPHPDMTPFMGVAFLHIVFFIWQNWLQKPNVLGISILDHAKSSQPYSPSETISLILLPNNRIGVFQRWQNDFGIARLQETDYQTLPRLLAKLKRQNATGSTVILIEPTKESTFGNLVSVLSTLKQVGGLPYLIADAPTDFERQMTADYERVDFTSRLTPALTPRQ